MLTGLNQHVLEQFKKTDLFDLLGEENVCPAEPRFGTAVNQAVDRAEAWMNQKNQMKE